MASGLSPEAVISTAGGEKMKIMFDYTADTGIKECKIMADNGDDEKHLMEVRHKIIDLLGASTRWK
jgi:hypothetical protein